MCWHRSSALRRVSTRRRSPIRQHRAPPRDICLTKASTDVHVRGAAGLEPPEEEIGFDGLGASEAHEVEADLLGELAEMFGGQRRSHGPLHNREAAPGEPPAYYLPDFSGIHFTSGTPAR